MRDRTHYVSGLWYLVSSRGGAVRFGEVVGSVDKCRGNSTLQRTTLTLGVIGDRVQPSRRMDPIPGGGAAMPLHPETSHLSFHSTRIYLRIHSLRGAN